MKGLAVVAVFLVAACGSVNVVQAHTISLAYKKGDTYKYALHFVLNYTVGVQTMSIPLNLDLSGKETMKVNSVDTNGVADATITVSDLTAKAEVNGTTNTTTTASTTVDVKIGPDGRIISVNGNAMGSSGSFPGMSGTDSGLVTAILPDNPVKPGDTWTKSYDEAGLMGSTGTLHVTTDNKYLRDEKVSNTDSAVVESKINATIDLTFDMSALAGSGGTSLFPTGGSGSSIQGMNMKGTTTSDVTSWIDSSARHIVKSHSTGTIDATLDFKMAAGQTMPGLTGPITFKGKQTLDMNPA